MTDPYAWPPTFEAAVRMNLGLGTDREITPASSLADLGLDSLAAVNLSVDLEEAFGVVFPDEALVAATFATAGSLWETVDRQRAASGLETPPGQT